MRVASSSAVSLSPWAAASSANSASLPVWNVRRVTSPAEARSSGVCRLRRKPKNREYPP